MSVCVLHFKCHLNAIWANTTNEKLISWANLFHYDSNSDSRFNRAIASTVYGQNLL